MNDAVKALFINELKENRVFTPKDIIKIDRILSNIPDEYLNIMKNDSNLQMPILFGIEYPILVKENGELSRSTMSYCPKCNTLHYHGAGAGHKVSICRDTMEEHKPDDQFIKAPGKSYIIAPIKIDEIIGWNENYDYDYDDYGDRSIYVKSNDLAQYPIERDEFANVIIAAFNNDFDKIEDLFDDEYESDKFKVWCHDNDCYILNKLTGEMVNWYKRGHYGRMLTSTLEPCKEEYIRFFNDLVQDIEENKEYK